MLYPAELRAHWSLQRRTAPAFSQVGLARDAEVFAFGSEFFNTRSRVPGRPSAQSGFLAGVLAGGCSAAFFIDRK
jgi:hypothetical protein